MSSQGKSQTCKVILLDDQIQDFQITRKSLGEDLFGQVVKHLQLMEADYFGLEFKGKDQEYVWLDREKNVLYQVGNNELSFKFKVKFYTPDPNLLEDEFTRYLFALQIKQDLATGRLVCNPNTTAMLAAYIAQGELGDYNEEEMADHTYLKCISFVPEQSDELEQGILQYHRGLGGMTPSEADFKLLDTARKTDYYGVILHSAADHEGVALQLAVMDSGIFVYQNKQRINTFSWAKIRKLSFKRKRFLIKLHPSPDQTYYKNIVEFYFPSRNLSKNFWKVAVEHHTFFRCRALNLVRKHRRTVLTRGSSFRYTGRTQKQLIDHVKDNYVKGSRSFERTLSTRHTLSVANRSYATSRSTTLNSKRDFHEMSMSSGSHVIGGSESQHSGFKTPASPAKLSPNRTVDSSAAYSPQTSKQANTKVAIEVTPQKSIDRKYSEPVLGKGHDLGLEDHKLARAPDYSNIPEKVEEPEDTLQRSDSYKNIPKVVEEDQHTEPNNYLHTPSLPDKITTSSPGTVIELPDITMGGTDIISLDTPPRAPSPALVRVHSETDTNSLVKHQHPQEALTNQTADHITSSHEETPAINTTFGMAGSDIMNGSRGNKSDTLTDSRKSKKVPVDKAYYIAKELLMTERTYHKDLSIVMENFQDYMAVDNAADITLSRLYECLQPLYDNHRELLDQLERRMTQCDSQISDTVTVDIGDLMVQHFEKIELYRNYLSHMEELLNDLVRCCETSDEFSKRLHEFETEKICYLPIFALILKPAHRLVYYEIILSKLVAHYTNNSTDFSHTKTSLATVTEVLGALRSVIAELENTEKLVELQEDVGGVQDMVRQGRYFIREGCLQKLSRRGYQQRLFILLSDVLLYTSRSPLSSQPQFKVHGYMPLSGMSLEESEPNTGATNGFTIYGANRCLIVAANTQEEKDKWLEDLNFAISIANSDQIELADLPLPKITPPSNGSHETEDAEPPSSPDKTSQAQHRANTTMHVCWHRSTSVSIKDIQNAIKHQLSGYLLRKFKNSNGWQKLWVVFTNFCLFFYKTYQDEFPLASLPLLGYSVSKPSASDGIHKDFVFKLQFKNHVYFFRAESEYTYDRWMEVINSATHSARRTRMFSRLDSQT